MKLETLISEMMTINVLARIWHWTTESAQHHVVFEQFLKQNELATDSIVESSLGNDIKIDFFNGLGVKGATAENYDINSIRSQISGYRTALTGFQKKLEADPLQGSQELISILDDAVENCSKTLYLLRLK